MTVIGCISGKSVHSGTTGIRRIKGYRAMGGGRCMFVADEGMPRMKRTSWALGAAWMLAFSGSLAADDVVAPTTLPPEPTSPSKWHVYHDPYCMPCCYTYNRLGVPYELVARFGPAFVVGGNDLDEILRDGTAFMFAARGFCYDEPHTHAWTAEFGVGGVIHDGDKNEGVIRRLNDATIRDVQPFNGPNNTRATFEVDSRYAVLRLSRVHIQGAGGYECYWFSSDPTGYRCLLGINAGSRLGHAKAQLRLAQRIFTPGAGPEDIATVTESRVQFHDTDIIYGIFAAADAAAVFPCWGCDVLLGIRGEIGRDWIDIVDADHTLDTATLQFTVAVRY